VFGKFSRRLFDVRYVTHYSDMVRSIRHKGLRRLHANWRVVFRFEARDARDIDPIDYH